MQTATELVAAAVHVEPGTYPDPNLDKIRFCSLDAEFVWPTLSSWSERDGSRLVLIEAPGAVGKTALAEAIAANLGWPLVNAAKARVGDYTFTGLLHDVFDLVGSPFISDMILGHTGVVIDALDEAHLKAGSNNFEAFIENVGTIAQSTQSRAYCTILLSRPDTAAIVKAKLDEQDTSYASAVLDFFSYRQACLFIETYLARKNRRNPSSNYDVAQKSPIPFARLRDSLFAEIIQTLERSDYPELKTAWSRAKNFVGYAPVLGVFAEALAVPNPHKTKLTGIEWRTSTEEILVQVIDHILEREQGKFQGQVVSKLWSQLPADAHWLNPEICYSAEEQAIRLVAKIVNCRISNPPPTSVPPALRPSYEQQARQFIDDHPFIADSQPVNVVFGDYIKAYTAASQEAALRLDRTAIGSVAEPGPFFIEFVHRFAPPAESIDGATGGKIALADLEILPLLADSLAQSSWRNAHYFSYLDRGAPYGFGVFSLASRNGERRYLEFEFAESSGILYFPRKLSHCGVFTERLLVLGDKGERFTLGPAVTISTPHLSIDATALSVSATPANIPKFGVSITCKGEAIHSPNLQSVDVHNDGNFAVSGKAWPVLYPFEREVPTAEVELEAEYVDLRAILVSFGRSLSGHPSAYHERLEQRIVKSDPTRQRILRGLISKSLIYRVGQLYHLDTDKLSSLGIGVRSINLGYPNDEVLALLRDLRPPQQ